jgi:hypothetical protein
VEWSASYFFFYSSYRTSRSSTRPALSFSTTEGGWYDECFATVREDISGRRSELGVNFSVERHRDVIKNCCSVGALTFF